MGIFGPSPTVFDQQLDKATDECNTEEDWGLIMKICDKIKTTTDGEKEFCKAILRKIVHKVPHVSLQALTILDSAVNNCGIDFKKEVASQEFINHIRNIMLSPPHPKVAAHLKMLIRQWSEDFKGDAQLSRLTAFYHFMRSEGVEFPTPEELSPKKSTAPVSKDPNVVSSQQETDDIAKAIEMSLKEENQKKGFSSSVAGSSSSAASSSLYPSMLGGSTSTSTNQSTSYTSGTSGGTKKTVKALYDFEAAEDNELTFKAGDLVSILDDSDANWWKGENANGQGLFPANFVTSDLTVEPEPDFGVGKPDDEQEEEGRTVSFNDEVEVKEVDLTEPVLEIDEALMDKTLIELQNTDPESGIQDRQELLQNGESCTQMGPLIDQKLEEYDRKHLEYTQLNEKILEALNMYDKLMNEVPVYNPRMPTSSYLKNPAATGMNPYGQQMVPGPQHGYQTTGNPAMYSQPQQMQQQANVSIPTSVPNPQLQAANMTNQYNMYQQHTDDELNNGGDWVGPPTAGSYPAHNGMAQQQPQQHGAAPQMPTMNTHQPQQVSYPQQVYSDSAVNSVMQSNQAAYSNQPNTAQQQQYATTNYTQAGQVPQPGQQQYNAAMQPLM